jgi:hypothetical protein
MLIYAALAIVFMIVCVAVPHMAANIAGGTIGLALSHAFEAAFIAQTVIRPITSALQTGFSKAAQLRKMVWSRWRRSRHAGALLVCSRVDQAVCRRTRQRLLQLIETELEQLRNAVRLPRCRDLK